MEHVKIEKDALGDLDPCILCGCIMHADTERRYKQLQYIASLVVSKCSPTSFVYNHITRLARDERISHVHQNQNNMNVGTVCPCGITDGPLPELPVSDVCMYGSRAPFCIACINWVRRLSKSKLKLSTKKKHGTRVNNEGFVIQNIIPLDNLILFIHNPGCTSEPDKRAMCRLLQNICIQYSTKSLCIRNPYCRFMSPLMDCVLCEFKHKYFHAFNFDSSLKNTWTKKRSLKNLESYDKVMNGRYRSHQGRMMQNNMGLVDDIVRIWWKFNGNTLVLQDRATAKYVRRMLRNT
jgi:hypothetical protein